MGGFLNVLGRIGKMARLQDLGKRVDMYQLPPALIEIDPGFNVRADTPAVRDHILAIAESIKSGGFMQTRPLTVRMQGDRVVVTDGHCRLLAVRLAIAEGCEIQTIPCLPEARGTNEADRALMLLTSNSGLPLTGLEQAEVVKRLLAFGWPESQIASRIGRTRQHVASLLELAEAPHAVREMVRDGAVSPTVAIAAIRQDGTGAAAVLQAAIAASPKGKATATQVASIRAPAPARQSGGIIGAGSPSLSGGAAPAPRPAADPSTLAGLARELIRLWDAGEIDGRFDAAIDALRGVVS
jgi:ParB-like chromosome segregation protein Spo0J